MIEWQFVQGHAVVIVDLRRVSEWPESPTT